MEHIQAYNRSLGFPLPNELQDNIVETFERLYPVGGTETVPVMLL